MARKILLADDSVTAQNMGRKILADAGYEVITVNNGSAALKKIGEQKPDLIVLDVYMPGYSGLEVCQRLKEVGETSRIPILLTVGKLEPFKTDEAKRVRADGFIVKPFEASELLSALSKLEDKIVPRGESKPGRFARATAAIEEGRDRTVAAEEDNGWKSRISFPSKKKEAAPEPPADDPAIYNPVNKDLRTVVDHSPSSNASHNEPVAKPENTEQKVDLGALAPEGLPKDVTPEEIAALAAAAAQMQGKILETKAAEAGESQAESKPEGSAVAAVPEPSCEVSATAATFADQGSSTQAEIQSESPSPAPSEKVAEPIVRESSISGAASEEPVTMAAAAGVSQSSRWIAVSVALAPEESSISLEQEMQKSYADFASAPVDATPVASEAPVAEPVSVAAPSAIDSVTETPATSVTAAVEPPASVAATASEPVSAVVKEFEAVSTPSAPIERPEEPTISADSDRQAESETAAVSVIESKSEPLPVAESPAAESPAPESVASQEPQALAETLPQAEEIPSAEAVVSAANGSESQSPSEAVSEMVEPAAKSDAEPAANSEAPEHKESDLSATTAAAWASWRKIRESSGPNHSEESSDVEKSLVDAAMAVAAGAEKSPDEAAKSESDPEISSIVDSVLADLRPKIVEEISRKLGKKK